MQLTSIRSIPHVVFDSFSNHGHGDHKHERKNGCRRVQRGNYRDRLKDCHYQKVDVSKSLKLDKETDWEKSYGRVLCCSNVI